MPGMGMGGAGILGILLLVLIVVAALMGIVAWIKSKKKNIMMFALSSIMFLLMVAIPMFMINPLSFNAGDMQMIGTITTITMLLGFLFMIIGFAMSMKRED
jgi:O-antigen ligase